MSSSIVGSEKATKEQAFRDGSGHRRSKVFSEVCDGHGHRGGGKLLAALPGGSPGLRSPRTERPPLISHRKEAQPFQLREDSPKCPDENFVTQEPAW